MLHHKKVYKYIHKKHHEWTASIGLTSLYAHPVEHIFSNILPPAVGPLLLGSHVATSWLWFCLALTSTLNSHSGYHLPFLPSPEVIITKNQHCKPFCTHRLMIITTWSSTSATECLASWTIYMALTRGSGLARSMRGTSCSWTPHLSERPSLISRRIFESKLFLDRSNCINYR